MKKLVKVEEVEGEGLVGLMGENVMLFCINYIYAGRLTGVNDNFVKLEKAFVVYETGVLNSNTFKDAQELPNDCYIMVNSVESFCKSGR